MVTDLFSRKVIGWRSRQHMKREVVIDALRMAWFKRHPSQQAGPISHGGRGSQYASKDLRDVLAEYGVKASMSRRGNCWDNACCETPAAAPIRIGRGLQVGPAGLGAGRDGAHGGGRGEVFGVHHARLSPVRPGRPPERSRGAPGPSAARIRRPCSTRPRASGSMPASRPQKSSGRPGCRTSTATRR